MCDEVVAVSGEGVLKFSVFSQFCEAIAGLIHDHPQAAEYTARRMGQIFERLDAEERQRRAEDAERIRATGARY